LRLFLKSLNKQRKKQAKKIDILCNDLIAAQREFIKKLATITFTAYFYELVLGTTDLNDLLSTAGRLIKQEVPDANVAFFLRRQDDFELRMFENEQPITMGETDLQSCFTDELVENICKLNKICNLDDMFAMGLQGSLSKLNKISGAAVPLGTLGTSPGFILIYRSSQNKLTVDELNTVAAIVPGLSRAIQSCRVYLQS